MNGVSSLSIGFTDNVVKAQTEPLKGQLEAGQGRRCGLFGAFASLDGSPSPPHPTGLSTFSTPSFLSKALYKHP